MTQTKAILVKEAVSKKNHHHQKNTTKDKETTDQPPTFPSYPDTLKNYECHPSARIEAEPPKFSARKYQDY